jgi:energy-coupling factor transporter ATP-binding protein EcfA2
VKLSCSYETTPKRPTCSTSYIQGMFGIDFNSGPNVIARDVEIDYRPGQIVLFVGPSGSGKSSLLRAAAVQEPGAVCLDHSFDDSRAIIDTLGPDPRQAAGRLSVCGLSEAMLMLRTPGELSDGQRYRYALARCLASGTDSIVADEWCATLDEVTARVISYNVRRLADTRGVGFMLAGTREDIIDDLQPDLIVRCSGGGVIDVEKTSFDRPRGPISFHDELDLRVGKVSDWPHFAKWHYRGHGLGPVRRVNLLQHREQNVGICIFGFGPLASAQRNRLFGLGGKMSSDKARIINNNFACVSRLVLDHRYRGAGIGGDFLRRACEAAPWPWIELISEMANLVPFYQAAGFVRTGRYGRKISKPSGESRQGSSRTCWGRSNWTAATYAKYKKSTRHSRPAYCIRDNR